MLVNAVEGFKAVGKDAEATEISRHALSLPEAHGQHLLKLWSAMENALAGNVEDARQVLQDMDRESLDQDYQFLWSLMECLVEMTDTSPDRRADVFREARNRLLRLRSYANWQFEPARRSIYRRTLRKISALHPNWFAKSWCA